MPEALSEIRYDFPETPISEKSDAQTIYLSGHFMHKNIIVGKVA